MLNLKSGVYNIETQQVEALFNLNAEGINYVPAVYRASNDYAFWIKNEQTNEVTIITGNKNVREVRNAIIALLGG